MSLNELFFNEYEALDASAFVAKAYEDLLGYEDASAMANSQQRIDYWLARIEEGGLSREEFAQAFVAEADGGRSEWVSEDDLAKNTAAKAAIEELGDAPESLDQVREAVAAAEVPEDTSGLTEALAALSTAQEARVDALEEVYNSNEDIADAVGDEFDAEATANAIDAAYDDAIEDTSGGADETDGVNDLMDAAVGDVSADRSDAYNQALIDEQESINAKAVSDAQETVDETEGLSAAVEAVSAAQAEVKDSLKAQSTTNAALAGAEAEFNTANSDDLNTGTSEVTLEFAPFTVAAPSDYTFTFLGNDGTNDAQAITADLTDLQEGDVLVSDGTDADGNAVPVVSVNAKGEIVVASDYKDFTGVDSLLAAVQADVSAIQGIASAEGDLEDSVAETLVLEGADEFGTAGTVAVPSDADTDSAETAEQALYTKDGVTYVVVDNDTGDASATADFYAVTDVTYEIAANGSVTAKATFDSSGTPDIIQGYDGSGTPAAETEADAATAAGLTAVSDDNPLSVDAADVDASAFIDLTADGYLKAAFATEAADSSALVQALEDQKAFDEAVERYVEAKALADQVEGLDDAVTDAREAITDEDEGLGINLREGSESFTVNDDVYLFNEEDSAGVSLAKFGANGEDKIFFGEGFSLVALGDDEIGDNVGDSSAMEIFWEQIGSDVNLYVEAEAFGGNASGTDDVVQVTLTGVDAADINDELAAGFLSAGEVA